MALAVRNHENLNNLFYGMSQETHPKGMASVQTVAGYCIWHVYIFHSFSFGGQ